MRTTLGLAAAAILAIGVPTSTASSTLAPPNGQWSGFADSGAHVIFSLTGHDRVVDFIVHGRKLFADTEFRFHGGYYGSFNHVGHNIHVWGEFHDVYGHARGGYSFTQHGHHSVHHWTAKADGF